MRATRRLSTALAIAAAAALLLRPTDAVRWSGSSALNGEPGMALSWLADFTVAGSAGPVAEVTYTLDSVSNASTHLLLFVDYAWGTAQAPTCDCACKTALAWAKSSIPPNAHAEDTFAITDVPAPHFFFVGVLVCNASARVDWKLHITFQNTGFSEVEYSGIGIVQTYTACAGIAVLLLLVITIAFKWWNHTHWYSTPVVVKLMAASILAWGMAQCLLAAQWTLIIVRGTPETGVEGAGRISETIGRLLFISSLMLVARGFSITEHSLSRLVWFALGLAITALSVLYLAMASWYLNERAADSLTYVYDSAPGLAVTALHGSVGLWFVAEVVARLCGAKLDAQKRSFYRTWGLTYGLYFTVLPVSVLVGLRLPDYQDERVVEITVQCSAALFYILTVALLRPGIIEAVFQASEPDTIGLLKSLGDDDEAPPHSSYGGGDAHLSLHVHAPGTPSSRPRVGRSVSSASMASPLWSVAAMLQEDASSSGGTASDRASGGGGTLFGAPGRGKRSLQEGESLRLLSASPGTPRSSRPSVAESVGGASSRPSISERASSRPSMSGDAMWNAVDAAISAAAADAAAQGGTATAERRRRQQQQRFSRSSSRAGSISEAAQPDSGSAAAAAATMQHGGVGAGDVGLAVGASAALQLRSEKHHRRARPSDHERAEITLDDAGGGGSSVYPSSSSSRSKGKNKSPAPSPRKHRDRDRSSGHRGAEQQIISLGDYMSSVMDTNSRAPADAAAAGVEMAPLRGHGSGVR